LKNNRIFITLALFFASVSFLVYEVIWDRLLSLYLGITVHASTIVVSAYMAGLAAGSYFIGKKAQNSKDPYMLLSVILILIASVNLAVYYLLLIIPDIKIQALIYPYSLGIVFMSAFFIGGVMPVVSRMFIESGNNTSQSIGNTFGADTIGSSLGGILAGFVLLGSLGMKNSIWLMTGLNLIMAAAVFFMPKNKPQAYVKEEKVRSKKQAQIKFSSFPKTALAVAFISGFVGLIAQIVWMRIFKVYLTNTSYTFSLIVSVTIFGYFIGTMIFRQVFKTERDHHKILLISLFFSGLIILSGVIIFINAPEWIILPLHESLKTPATRILLPPVILSLLTVLPQAILSGFIFSNAIKLYDDKSETLSTGFSRIYFINTLGAFTGPFTAAFVLIPGIGAVKSLMLISFIAMTCPLILIFKSKQSANKAVLIFGSVCAVIVFAMLFTKPVKIMPPSFSQDEREILFYKEAVEATLVVGKDKKTGLNYTYFNNNSVIGSSYDAVKAVKLLGHLPFLTGKVPENVLIVGFGIGVTTSTVLLHREVRSVECVELAEELKEAAGFYKDLNNDVVSDPRLKIIGNDGRHYLQMSDKKYDLISSDPTHPVLGSGGLYSKEYFQLCYDHLSDDGMVTQYLPLHKLLPKDYAGIIRTFNSVFENTTVWLGHTHTLLAGTKKPLKIEFADFKAKAAMVQDQYLYNNPYSLASFLIFDKNSLSSLTGGSEICSDDRSYLDFFAMNSFLPENWAYNAENILKNMKNTDVFYNVEDPQMLERFRVSTKIVLQALIQSMSGNPQGYIAKLYEALSITPENQEISFLIKLEGMKKGE